MMTDRNRETACAYLGRLAAGDVDGALALTGDGFRFTGPDGATKDREEMRAFFIAFQPLLAAPMAMEIDATIAEGDRVAIQAHGGAPLTNGRVYSNTYCFLFELRDGAIVAMREYCDLRQAAVFAE